MIEVCNFLHPLNLLCFTPAIFLKKCLSSYAIKNSRTAVKLAVVLLFLHENKIINRYKHFLIQIILNF